jgi:hypothetical protein
MHYFDRNELPRRKQRGIKETTDDRPKGRGIEPSPASGGIKIQQYDFFNKNIHPDNLQFLLPFRDV